MLKHLFLIILLGTAHAAPLPPSIATALQANKIPASALSIVVQAAQSEYTRLEHQPDLAVNPASTLKLVSTLVALERMGPQFSWQTGLYSSGTVVDGTLRGDLYLKGSGDPKLTFERLWLLLRDLQAKGIHKIDGDLILDRSLFQIPTAQADFDEQPERAYNVAPDALLLNFNALRLDLEADAHTLKLHMEPPLFGVSLDPQMKLTDQPCANWSTGWGRPQIIRHKLGQPTLSIRGSFPKNCTASRYLAPLPTEEFSDRLIRGLWQQLGGEISGPTRAARTPEDARLLVQTSSASLAEIIRDINKQSNNSMARILYLGLGAHFAGLGSLANADAATQSWLAEKGLQWPELVMDNGSGLSRQARISARHLAQVLALGRASNFAPEYLSSLPIVALDGTMRKRLHGSSLAAKARVKTGSLDGVKSVAGYVKDGKGRDWLVVGILNHPRAASGGPVLDALLEWAAEAE